MLNKLDVYDIFSLFLPGAVLIFGFIFLFPGTCEYIGIQDALIKFTSFVIFSFIVGHLLNAIKSHSVWKGVFEGKERHPTAHVFQRGLDDSALSLEYAKYIKEKITNYKSKTGTLGFLPSDGDCFHFAMQLQVDHSSEKQLKLYAQYELYRTINVAIVLIGFLFVYRIILHPNDFTALQTLIVLISLSTSFLLFRSMIKSRANYWARDILFCAEKIADMSVNSNP